MKHYRLILITENQNTIEKAKKLSTIICEKLGCQGQINILRYEKFANSYSIEILGTFSNDLKTINDSIELTDRICSPWSVKLNRDVMEVELIFNKTDSVVFRDNHFNVIKWASFEIDS